MSIQLRLNLAITLVVAAALGAIIATTILKAGPRIRAENESIMRLSKEFVETAVDSLKGMRDPAAGLGTLIDGLKDLRHVEIVLTRGGASAEPGQRAKVDSSNVPPWFQRLIGQPRMVARLPVDVDGMNYGDLVISSKSSDEIREIWESTQELVIYGALLAAMTIGLASLIVKRAVDPVIHLGEALSKLEEGNYLVRVPEAGPPEIAAIGAKLNALASALGRERTRNSRLTERMLDIQDAERKELAHELHDELGPHLFTLRAAAAALGQESRKASPDTTRLVQGSATLVEQIEAIQRTNRRVLERLRPVTLSQFGLAEALGNLAAGWRKERPDVVLDGRVTGLERLSESVELTIYRVVQEGLTNAYRHSGAKRIGFEVAPAGMPGTPSSAADSKTAGMILVRVHDDGAGMRKPDRASFGLTGMQERVAAVGGTIEIREGQGRGVEIIAGIPAIGRLPGDLPRRES